MAARRDKIGSHTIIRPPELQEILRTLRNRLPSEAFGFEPSASTRGVEYGLVGAAVASAYSGRSYRVVPLHATWTYDYWIGAVVRYVLIGGLPVLDAVGLPVFRGERTDDQKVALFRIEWDCPAGVAQGRHAQPHWHVYSASVETIPELDELNAVAPLVNFGDAPTEEGSVERSRQYDFGRFHFALAARWHLSESDAHLTQPVAATLPTWIGSCVDYVAQQLDYLADKSAA